MMVVKAAREIFLSIVLKAEKVKGSRSPTNKKA